MNTIYVRTPLNMTITYPSHLGIFTDCYCLCSLSPRLIDMGKVYRQTNQENLEQAFGVAERDLGVTRLLDPEGKAGPG